MPWSLDMIYNHKRHLMSKYGIHCTCAGLNDMGQLNASLDKLNIKEREMFKENDSASTVENFKEFIDKYTVLRGK